MKIVVAIDSFKGSLASLEAGAAAQSGILSVMPTAQVKVFPLADGGEGTCNAITQGLGGEIKSVVVSNPLGEKISAQFGEISAQKLAVTEMANASGLPLVPLDKRNPLNTTTYGVGEIIRQAIGDGCRNFIIGIGGSATNDCGLGMLTALGFKFTDVNGKPCGIFGRDLANVAAIDDGEILPELSECKFKIACDVINPLTGVNGCSAVYAPQKGATPEIVALMDDWIKNFGNLSAKFLNLDKISVPGDGAAGGLGFAFRSYLRGELVNGVDLVLDTLNIADDLKNADILITGEGRLDNQTANGKAPSGVAKLAKKLNPKILTIGLGGTVADLSDSAQIDAAFSVLREPMTLAEAMKKSVAERNIFRTAADIFRLIQSLH
ncbi:MAG: glycerate kinase [Selenomonadaceae bacterium]|nr:glycerate kinase [Selenomonadaceae bacterium]